MEAASTFTVADLEALPDTLDDTRYELIDGEFAVTHQPHTDGKLPAAPELAIEILSPGMPNEKRDRDLKPKLYAREDERIATRPPGLPWRAARSG